MSDPIRIAVLHFSHETVTFLKNDTTLDDFIYPGSPAKVHLIPEGVALAKQAVARGETPVVLADHSDRSGSATWLLKEIIAQDLSDTLIATIADAKATAKLKAQGVKAGDPFDMEIGGRADESVGDPVRIRGTIINAVEGYGQFSVCVRFGQDNVLILSTYLVQVMEPFR
jgi:microcystin degradation protein MlrC